MGNYIPVFQHKFIHVMITMEQCMDKLESMEETMSVGDRNHMKNAFEDLKTRMDDLIQVQQDSA